MNINALTASKIKELRLKNGLTAEAMASDLGISKSAYSQLENGKVELTLTRIEAIAQLFTISIAELIPTATHNQVSNGSGGIYNHTNEVTNNFFGNPEESLQKMIWELQNTLTAIQNK